MLLQLQVILGQSSLLNRQQFFLVDRVIEVSLTTDIKKLRTQKKVPAWQPCNITMRFSDTSVISEEIRVQPRGIYRKFNCDIAALMLNFKNPSSPNLSPLKKLKLVGGCRIGSGNEDLLLKEYLVYKIYNSLSVMSFRVRLLHINYKDSKQKYKPYSQYAFLIEDMKDLSERNNCVEVKKKIFARDGTDREQMTLVNLFQYMVGNTDWSIPNYHNIKLMVPKNDTFANPYVVPYDFDYAGLVDAPYAVPNEHLSITTVRERYYKGFPSTMDELQESLIIFKEKKDVMMFNINNFLLLNTKVKNEMIKYLEEFYQIINDKRAVRTNFISNARTN
jgi:hypothetical protein